MQLPLVSCPSTADSLLPASSYCTATLPGCLHYMAMSMLPCCLHCMALSCLVAYIAWLYVAPLFGNAIGQDEKCMCASSCISLVTHFRFSHVCHFCFSHNSHQFILSKKTEWQLHEKKMQSDCWWHAPHLAEHSVLNTVDAQGMQRTWLNSALNTFDAHDKADLGEQLHI